MSLQRVGKILHLGLCNVSIPEVKQAERHFPVRVVQNEQSVIDRNSAKEGVLALALEMGVPFLAHRSLGGSLEALNPCLAELLSAGRTRVEQSPFVRGIGCRQLPVRRGPAPSKEGQS